MSDKVYNYKEDIVWSLPCLFQYEAVFAVMQNFIKRLGFNHLNAELYGAPATVWSGGRKPVIYDKLNAKQLSNLFNFVKELNSTPVLTFNCTDISQDELKDDYANMILDVALEHDCKFMVYSDILRDYIKEKNEKAFIISSVLKPVFYFQGPNRIENPDIEKETQYYNKLLETYDMVSVRAEYSKFALSKNTVLLKDLSKIQVLINQSCLCDCNFAPEHAKFNERFKISQEENLEFICQKMNLPTMVKYKNNAMHTKEEIETLIKAGVNNLKIKGRGGNTDPYDMLLMFISLILRTDGPNYMCIQGMSPENIEDEKNYFAAKVINNN